MTVVFRTRKNFSPDENFSLQSFASCGVLGINMNKLILILTVAAFACVSAAQAGDAKSKASGSCCDTAKTVSTANKTSCSASQSACSATTKQAKKSRPGTAKGAYMAQLALAQK